MVQGANWSVIGDPTCGEGQSQSQRTARYLARLSTYTLDGAFTRPALWGSLDGLPKMLAYTCSVRLTSNCSAFS
jgi:hypothetical protein